MTEQQTDRECGLCDDGYYVKTEYDLYCPSCGYTPRDMRVDEDDPWEVFWQQRQQYSGHYGSDRKRCVGGFLSVWDDE